MTGKNKNSRQKRNKIPIMEQIRLWVRAGARCEFRGCPEYLYRDDLTLKEANYSEIAHIVAASEDGPRGDDPLPFKERNKSANLMLLCKKHHKLVDCKEHVNEYPVTLLREFKKEHESRIHRLTGLKTGHKTTVVRLRSRIADNIVEVSPGEIYEAISPRYPDDTEIEIDLSALPGTDSKSYWKTGQEVIDNAIAILSAKGINSKNIQHLSIFAFGPIPLLIYLGHRLGNKVPMDIFQKHRKTDNWIWQKRGEIADYRIKQLTNGKQFSKVGLAMSLSGTIPIDDLPEDFVHKFPTFCIMLKNKRPSPMYIQRREDLSGFKETYHAFFNFLKEKHKQVKELHLFPAVPLSIALVSGAERLPKVYPPLVVYDYNEKRGGFYKTLTVR